MKILNSRVFDTLKRILAKGASSGTLRNVREEARGTRAVIQRPG
jgi:hypothetical protein